MKPTEAIVRPAQRPLAGAAHPTIETANTTVQDNTTAASQPIQPAPETQRANGNQDTLSPSAFPTQPVGSPRNPTVNNNPSAGLSNYQFQMLARIISAEAKGEPLKGQVAVGAVILNRVESGIFPKTIAANVLKRGQFEPVANGQIWNEPTPSAVQAARMALNGWDPTNGAIYFFNPAKTNSRWIKSRPVVTQIGNHVFAV